jgi:hypothetical protein
VRFCESPAPYPRYQSAGSIGGTTARAREGGNKAFHGNVEGTDGVRASARGKLMARKRWVR